jgi:hypothetical protein
LPRLVIELPNGLDNREAGTSGAIGVIVVGLRPAEESHHPVAEIFRHLAIELTNRCGGRAMESGERLAPLLGIEPSGDRSRAQHVAEQHRQMPPFAVMVDTFWRILFFQEVRLEASPVEEMTGSAKDAPQCPQNFACRRLSTPHFKQRR